MGDPHRSIDAAMLRPYRAVSKTGAASMQSERCRLSSWLVAGLLAGAAASAADLPRLPDGTPDLQGIWTGGTFTPFERPPQLGTQLPESARDGAQRTATEKFW